MPVVNTTIDRLKKFLPSVKIERVIDALPFVGLDIEGIDGDAIRIEYNPNRPDFSSDYGIVRALRGLLEVEIGVPSFKMAGKSGCAIIVKQRVKKIRPFIVALVAKNGRLDDQTIKQIIAMQEDLQNGVGRRRKKASIGIHGIDSIHFPVIYKTVDKDYSFVPLAESSSMSIEKILKESEIGKQYGHILAGANEYPVIVDSIGTTISFPPIINGNETKVDAKCRNLFVEVTANDQKAAEDILAIIAVTLYDAGFEIGTTTIDKTMETPRMQPSKTIVNLDYVNSILGLKLNFKQAITCLKKSRLNASATGNDLTCTVPRYRTDISHPIDIAEEIAIGYGIYNLEPTFPAAYNAGGLNFLSVYFDAVRETMTGLGMLESINFSLTSKAVQYDSFDIKPNSVLSVDSSKSTEHEVLRESLLPSLIQSLSRNVHEEYPQKIFEIGKTFHKKKEVEERWNLGAVIAYGEANYTEMKSALQALLKSGFGKYAATKPAKSPFFMQGRCAEIIVDNRIVGTIGEIKPMVLESFKLRVPVAAFEMNLSALTKLQ